MEVIEAMAREIYKKHPWIEDFMEHKIEPWEKSKPELDTAQALLNLRYDCEECLGGGHFQKEGRYCERIEYCPACKGTGKGSRMLAILAQNQEPPKYDHSLYMISAQDVAWVQKQMIKVDADGYAFGRVKVTEGNNAER